MKWAIILLIALTMINAINADDGQLATYICGDNELVVTLWGDNQNIIFGTVILPTGSSTGGVGTGDVGGRAGLPYYDIIIEGIDVRYRQAAVFNVSIIIINKGDHPDRDAILNYFLFGPDISRYFETQEVFEEVPKTCSNNTYNPTTDLCEYECNSTICTYTPLKTILKREISIPTNATLGEWRFYVTYKSEFQDEIDVYKSFEVIEKKFDFFYLLMYAGIAYGLYILLWPEDDDEEDEENEENQD